MNFTSNIKLVTKAKNSAPKWLRNFVTRRFRCFEFRKAIWLGQNPHENVEQESSYNPKSEYVLGIVKGLWNSYWPYIAACRDLGVAYKVLDISVPDWIDVVEDSGCDAFLVWPSIHMSIWKEMFDERLRIMTEELDKIIYPDCKSTWIYESKRKMHYWLQANNIPHPKTWVFYDLDQALDFAEKVELPIVFKSDFGSGASGVKIFRHRVPLIRFVKRCFRKGFVRTKGYPLDRQWGSMFFQEYLPDIKEWRILRLGNSYFGHQKLKKGAFHSGSGLAGWYDPPKQLLDFVRNLTNKAGFSSMDLDVFETVDGRYLVNELQSLFGSYLPSQMYLNGIPGRYVYGESGWYFEEGLFNQNASCDLRVETLLSILEERKNK